MLLFHAHIRWLPKPDTVHDFHVMLEVHHIVEDQLRYLTYRMETGYRFCWLPTQVALNVVHHLRRPGKCLATKDTLSFLADEGERALDWETIRSEDPL
jgi:IS5 family transposase